jgi:phage tail sheath gpL-like
MAINANSIAPAVSASVNNQKFLTGANVIERKFLLVGTYDVSKTDIVDNEPREFFSSAEAGNLYGFGSMLHRMAIKAEAGAQGGRLFISPQAEAGGAVAADGSIDFTGSTGVLSGTIALYLSFDRVPVAIPAGTSADDIAIAVAAAINADSDLPVSAAVDGVTTAQVNITAKSKGPWGNDISIELSKLLGEELPVGVTATITDMASGAGIPDIDDVLTALGTGDDSNEDFYTDAVHGYGLDTSTLDKVSVYVGEGNEKTGCYAETVSRPMRWLNGDVDPGSAALTALIAITDTRKQDRANGVVGVPGSASHPVEIACQAMGVAERINDDLAQGTTIGQYLTGVDVGAKADRWTSDYDVRDTAMKSGVGVTKIVNGAVQMQGLVTFYRPDSVAPESNGYRSMRNISITQNVLSNVRLNFEQDKWVNTSVVNDVAKVTNINSRLRARDANSVLDDLTALAISFEGLAWIFSSSFTINELKKAGAVTIRSNGTGFDNILKLVYSGEGGILNTEVQFDTSLAIFL